MAIISKLGFYPLPYVDGTPASGQQKLDWIRNGECASGALNTDTNEGSLNRPGVQIQTNVSTIDLNSKDQVNKINEIVDSVNMINDNLSHIGDTSLITQVDENKNNIADLYDGFNALERKQFDDDLNIKTLQAQVGVHNSGDPLNRTLYDEAFFQKTEIGAYPGFDINGLVSVGSAGSGMKYRISSAEGAVLSNSGRIQVLEDNWNKSQVSALTTEIEKLRGEVGPTEQSIVGKTIYQRMKVNEEALTEISGFIINSIKAAIDYENEHTISDRMLYVEGVTQNNAGTIGDVDSGLVKSVADIELILGSIEVENSLIYRVDKNEKTINDVDAILGDTSSTGIRGQVALINTQIGDATQANSIEGRLKSNGDNLVNLTTETMLLKTAVGDNTTGMVAAVSHIGKDMYGDVAATDPIRRNGILATTGTLVQQMTSTISDVPDTNYYARTQGNWVKLPFAKGCFEKDINVNIVEVGAGYSIDTSNADTSHFTPPVQIINTDPNLVVNDIGTFQIVARTYVTSKSADCSYKVGMYVNDVLITEQVRWAIGHNNEDIFTIEKLINLANASNTIEFKLTGLHNDTIGETSVHLEIVIVAA